MVYWGMMKGGCITSKEKSPENSHEKVTFAHSHTAPYPPLTDQHLVGDFEELAVRYQDDFGGVFHAAGGGVTRDVDELNLNRLFLLNIHPYFFSWFVATLGVDHQISCQDGRRGSYVRAFACTVPDETYP